MNGLLVRLYLGVHESVSVNGIPQQGIESNERKGKGGEEDKRPNRIRTIFPLKKNLKVGVGMVLHLRKRAGGKKSISTSTLKNSTLSRPFFFSRASTSNMGSIDLHCTHVADVNIATAARYDLKKESDGRTPGSTLIAPLSGDPAYSGQRNIEGMVRRIADLRGVESHAKARSGWYSSMRN